MGMTYFKSFAGQGPTLLEGTALLQVTLIPFQQTRTLSHRSATGLLPVSVPLGFSYPLRHKKNAAIYLMIELKQH